LSSIIAGPGEGAHIDPRMRARRIAVQRDHGHRRLQRLIELGLVLAVAAGFLLALRSPLLDVGEVRVSGSTHTDPAVIRTALGVRPGEPLMDVDLSEAGRAVAALPWIRTVELHRGLDGVVAVQVTERTPIAVAGAAGQEVLVDAEGNVIAAATDDPKALTTLARLEGIPAGAPGTALSPSSDDALAVAGRLAVAAPGLVASIATDHGEVVGTLAQGGRVRLGDLAQLEAKVRSLRTVLDQVDLHCLGEIDVRLPGNPVLTREEGCS
jgi:cell division protein FtsQ